MKRTKEEMERRIETLRKDDVMRNCIVVIKGVYLPPAPFEDCANYANWLVNGDAHLSPSDIVIIDAETGEVIPA